MTENNVNKSADMLTAEYILKQIEKVQEQLADLKNTVNNIGNIGDSNRCGKDVEANVTVHDDVALEKIAAITEVFHHREESLQKLLEFYAKAFDSVK